MPEYRVAEFVGMIGGLVAGLCAAPYIQETWLRSVRPDFNAPAYGAVAGWGGLILPPLIGAVGGKFLGMFVDACIEGYKEAKGSYRKKDDF